MEETLTVGNLFDFAIEIERNGYRFYTETAKKFNELKMMKLFHLLAEQEMRHERFFKHLKEKGPTAVVKMTVDDLELYRKEYLDTFVFGNAAHTDEQIRRLDSLEDVVKLAINFEKDTVVLYSGIKRYIEPEDTSMLDKIINEELSHIGRLLELMQSTDVELTRGEDY